MNEVNECLEGWEEKGYDGIVAAHAILEYSQWIDDLKSGGYSQKPILQIGHMASNTAASMYYEAKMSKQDPSLLNELYSKFLYFYSYTDKKTNKFRTLQLFRMCPFVYYVCKRIYRLRSSIKENNLNKK